MYDTILVATDGSEHAQRAAEHGLALARAFDATVHAVHAVDLHAAAGPFDVGGVSEEFVGRLEQEGEAAVEAIADEAGDAVAVETAVVRGPPAEAIREYAAEHGADLVAVGTHGRSGLERYVAGSVAERVVRRAGAPVLTARATDRGRADGYDEILLPTDGSENVGVAIDHGLAIARRFDATVHAVNVVDVGDIATASALDPPTELFERFESEGREATERIAQRARNAGLDAVTDVREGTPATGLLEYADANDVDLVAMGTTGRTGPGQHLLGSTTERVFRRADAPVLAVDARGRAD